MFSETFDKLQKFINENDIKHINTPLSVGLYTDGIMYLSYSLSNARVVVKDLEQAEQYIITFLEQQARQGKTLCLACNKFL